MKQLSSTLSKPRRRVYRLLIAGLAVALVATSLGGLIFGLGRSRPDVIIPFSEFGQYLLLLGVVNLGIYGTVFWQVGRLARREPRKPSLEHLSLLVPVPEEERPPADPSSSTSDPVREPSSEGPRRISRQVRGTLSSLNLDP